MPKRKRGDDSDDELGRIGCQQILPVANLPDDFSGVPIDGMQYLFTVRRDARNLPRITRAINPYEQPSTAAAADTSPPPIAKSRHPQIPSEDWRAVFEKRFRNFRKNVVQPTIYVEQPPSAGQVMPDKKDREHWWAFIAGRPASEWTASKNKKNKKRRSKGMRGFPEDDEAETWHINDEGEVERADPTESLPTPSGSPAPDGTAYKPREPTPALLKHMDSRMCLHLLMYMTHWINLHLQEPESGMWSITETHWRWMFSLLSRVEERLCGDDMSLLRNLARAVLCLVKKGDEDIAGMWVIVTAIICFWGQRDLWNEFT